MALPNTKLMPVPLVPEISLYLVAEPVGLFDLTGGEFRSDEPPPFWAFVWAGGQALARYLLDHPAEVAGRRVHDEATGSGIVAIAAALAGAADVTATDVDPAAVQAAHRNAVANGVNLGTGAVNLRAGGADLGTGGGAGRADGAGGVNLGTGTGSADLRTGGGASGADLRTGGSAGGADLGTGGGGGDLGTGGGGGDLGTGGGGGDLGTGGGGGDLGTGGGEVGVVVAGDVFYSPSVAPAITARLRAARRKGADVLVGDPGRGYFPEHLFDQVAEYVVPVPAALEDAESLSTGVWRMR